MNKIIELHRPVNNKNIPNKVPKAQTVRNEISDVSIEGKKQKIDGDCQIP